MSNNEPVSPYLSLLHSRFSATTLHGPHQHRHMQRAQMLDLEIQSLGQAIFEARRMRNMSAGPCRLPPELLTQIFEDCQWVWEPSREVHWHDSESEPDLVFLTGWMAITHVCSYWRKVALGASSLWSKPEIDVLSIHPGYIPDILSRCRGNTIELHLDPESVELADEGIEDDVSLQAWFSPNVLSQVGGLTIAGAFALVEFAATRFPQDMTRLHRLYLDIANPGLLDPVLPAQFLNLPAITDLTLISCALPLASPLFSPRLTRLELYRGRNTTCGTYIEIRDTFTRTSSLKELEMVDVVPGSTPQDNHNLTVELPSSLRTLSVRVSQLAIVADGLKFMSGLSFPPQCSVAFHVGRPLAMDEESDYALKRVLQQLFLAKHDAPAAQHLVLGYNSVTVASTELQVWASRTRDRTPVANAKGAVIHTFSITEFPYARHIIPPYDMTAVLAFIHLENLHVIALTSEIIHTIAANSLWKSLLAAINIQRIDVEPPHLPISTHFHNLRNALCRRHGQISSDGSRSQFLFPRLRTLVLHLTAEDRKNTELAISLIELVRSRAELGVPIHEIMFPSPIPSGAGWDTLRAAVKVTPTELKVMR